MTSTNLLKRTLAVQEPLPAQQFIGVVSSWDENSQNWIIDHQYPAKLSVSQLMRPMIGAEVLYVADSKINRILHILSQPEQTAIELESALPLKIHAPDIALISYKDLSLVALNKVSLTGKQLAQAATDNLVCYAHNLVQQVHNFSLNAKGLLRSHGKQQVMTAREDVRIDGKRINMG